MRHLRSLRFLCPLILGAALLAGCGASPAEPPGSPLPAHTGQYEAEMQILYRGLDATATISRKAPDACTVRFTAPDSLRELEFVFRQDAVDLAYRGLQFQFDPDAVPSGAAAKIAVDAIGRAMQDKDVEFTQSEEEMSLRGTLGAGPFTLLLDPVEGAPAKLLVPGAELEIKFVQFTFLDG